MTDPDDRDDRDRGARDHDGHDPNHSHGHGHEDGHDHGDHDHDHGGHDGSLGVAVLTITTTRDPASDEGGAAARRAIVDAGHGVVDYDTVPDAIDAIQERVLATSADAVITTGGTGLTPDDVTVEALRPLFEKELPGFGEYFRRLSHDDVGTRAMLSRATAGVVDGTPVYALPGSPAAVTLGVERAVLPELGHAVGLARRE